MIVNQVYEVTNSSPEYKTLGDYLSAIESPAFAYVNDVVSFLLVRSQDNTISNRDSLVSHYTDEELRSIISLTPKEYPLKTGTKFYIPTNKVTPEGGLNGVLTQGVEVVSNNFPAFKAEQLALLEVDRGYERVYSTYSTGSLSGGLKVYYPNVTVWVWCRGLSSTPSMEGTLLDITPFIEKLSTSVTKTGGNFQITLPPLVCVPKTFDNYSTKWVLDTENHLQFGDDYAAIENINSKQVGGKVERNEFLFHNVLSTNDLFFIRFETMEMEAKVRLEDETLHFLSNDKLPGRLYDMIGLLDRNSISLQPSNNDVAIEIQGRDLIKIFIEDGTYFYNLENVYGQFRVAGSSQAQNLLQMRTVGDNTLQHLSIFQNLSIKYVLEFVITQLANIEVVPTELFEYFKNRNRGYVDPSVENLKNNRVREHEIELRKEEVLQDLQIQVPLTRPEAEMKYKELLDFVTFLDKKEGGVIYGWKKITFNGQVLDTNQLPNFVFNQLVYQTSDNQKFNYLTDTLLTSLLHKVNNIVFLMKTQPIAPSFPSTEKKPLNGIWQIIKLVIDEGVADRRIVDSSLSSANNSLLSYFKKVCQEPFVEFYTDTYGDSFNLIVRKPPTDKVGMRSLLNGPIRVEKGGAKILYEAGVVNIDAEDVIKEDFVWDDKEVYSWYHFTPQNAVFNGSELPTAYVPSIYFEEYGKIWGSRPLDLVHNYTPYLSSIDMTSNGDASKFQTQAAYDLKYLIESNAYKPFTRTGSLTVNGDRRLKRGNLIRYTPTGEIFTIDSVSQNYSISDRTVDRTTTMQLSRGMMEKFIEGVEIEMINEDNRLEKVMVSYFDIINTNLQFTKKTFTAPDGSQMVGIDMEKVYESMKVNKNIFNFFIRREQFNSQYR